MGPRRDGHRALGGRRARRHPRGGGSRSAGAPRRAARRQPLREADPPRLRGVDPAREGAAPGGPARVGDERRAVAPVHRAPLRAVVPGYIGARSVKWLERIELRREPSGGYYPATAYRLDDEAMSDVAVNSDFLAATAAANGNVDVRGYAFAGGDRHVAPSRCPRAAGRGARPSSARTSGRGRGGCGARGWSCPPAATSSRCARGTARARRSRRTRRRSGTPRATRTTRGGGSRSTAEQQRAELGRRQRAAEHSAVQRASEWYSGSASRRSRAPAGS